MRVLQSIGPLSCTSKSKTGKHGSLQMYSIKSVLAVLKSVFNAAVSALKGYTAA